MSYDMFQNEIIFLRLKVYNLHEQHLTFWIILWHFTFWCIYIHFPFHIAREGDFVEFIRSNREWLYVKMFCLIGYLFDVFPFSFRGYQFCVHVLDVCFDRKGIDMWRVMDIFRFCRLDREPCAKMCSLHCHHTAGWTGHRWIATDKDFSNLIDNNSIFLGLVLSENIVELTLR